MKRLVITSINFMYDNGRDKPSSGIDILFDNFDAPYSLAGKVTLSRDAYNAVRNDEEALKFAVLERVMDYYGIKLQKEDAE